MQLVSLVQYLKAFNHSLTMGVVFPSILFLGLYLSIRLNLVQLRMLPVAFRQLLKKQENAEGNISHYEAIASVLAGNFGTGNISGMAVALSTGGPGALVWMWIMAFLGSAIQYASCILGVQYRTKNSKQEYVGGPMYYLSSGLGWNKLAAAFALFTIFAAFTVGNFAQVNSIALPLAKIGIHPLLSGVAVALLTAAVILGGISRFAKVASSIVPIMALFYFASALYILAQHISELPRLFAMMFRSAFDLSAGVGGVLGYGMLRAISTGFDRGLFATDAGTGIVPIMQAGARSEHPVMDGVVTLVAPICVMVVCTTTALVLLATGVWRETGLESTLMVTEAFTQGMGGGFGYTVVILSLVLFSYTTILAWGCCGEKACGYLFGTHNVGRFQLLYILLIPLGALLRVDLTWVLADLCISLMLITNLAAVARLSPLVIGESRAYFATHRV